MFEIEKMKQAISARNGLARQNLFRIELPLRVGGVLLSQGLGGESNKEVLNVMCTATQLPGRQMLSSDRVIGFKPEKMVYGYETPDVNLSFYDNNKYTIRRYFEAWQNRIISPSTKEVRFKGSYSADVYIGQYDHAENYVYGVSLIEAFPSTLNVVELNNDPNGLVQINVQLTYTNWR